MNIKDKVVYRETLDSAANSLRMIDLQTKFFKKFLNLVTKEDDYVKDFSQIFKNSLPSKEDMEVAQSLIDYNKQVAKHIIEAVAYDELDENEPPHLEIE